MKMIASFEDHEHIEGQFLLGNVSKGVNANGGAYLSVELRDASGSIVGKKWDATLEDEQLFVVGNVVQVVGETNKYKDQLQLKILSAELVPLEQIDVEKFVKAPPVAKETLIERFNAHVNSIKNEDCLKLLKYMINKFGDKRKFSATPASSSDESDSPPRLIFPAAYSAIIATKAPANAARDMPGITPKSEKATPRRI